MIWVLEHLADLESDFSRFHRIDDLYQLDGPKFFRLAWRISTYGGVMAMRLESQREAASPAPSSPSRAAPARPSRAQVKSLAAFMVEHPDMIARKRAA